MKIHIDFFIGLLLPIVIVRGAKAYEKWYASIREFYIGMPLRSWLAMWMILKGARILISTGKPRGVFVQTFNKRKWISPDTEHFKEQ